MRVVERFVTSAPPALVWRVLADVEHWPEWTPTVIEIRPLDGRGLAVGARFRVLQPKLRPATYEGTECVPNQRFTWMQKLPGGALFADHRLAAREKETEVELSFASEGLLPNIVAALFSKIIREYVAIEARSLQHQCDALGSQSALQRPSLDPRLPAN